MLNNTNVLYVFNPILLTNVLVADLRIILQPEAYSFHFSCERAFTIAKNIIFYIKNKQARPAQI